MSYVHSERVRFGDLDAMRHLNNVVFLRVLRDGAHRVSAQLVPAHDPANPERDDFGVIFAECHINYRSTVYFDETVEVRCTIGSVRRSSFRVEFEMRVEGRLVAEGYGVLVGFDYVNHQAAQLPERCARRWTGAAAERSRPQAVAPTHDPAPPEEPGADRQQARGHQRVQAPPHADDAPADVQRQQGDRHEHANALKAIAHAR